jgi:hypothetical protein
MISGVFEFSYKAAQVNLNIHSKQFFVPCSFPPLPLPSSLPRPWFSNSYPLLTPWALFSMSSYRYITPTSATHRAFRYPTVVRFLISTLIYTPDFSPQRHFPVCRSPLTFGKMVLPRPTVVYVSAITILKKPHQNASMARYGETT